MLEASEAALARWVRLRRTGETDVALFQRQLELSNIGPVRGTAFRCVAVLDNGRLAGCFNINSISRGLVFEADFSWWVSSEFVGRGLATEAGEAMLEKCFLDIPTGLGLHRVHAAIHSGNAPSRRVAEKLGFARNEGANVQVKVDDTWENHLLYVRSVTV
jgi:ribosomal-protein-alanine N-acetyltransferase